MKKYLLLILTFAFCFLTCAQRDYTKLVNPFIGTGGHGHTYPGASMPFGMMQLSPDTRMADWDGSSGYHYSDSLIYGFSHTHLSGTGIPDYCDILFMPSVGFPGWDKQEYRSGFKHSNENASPGYYKVLLDKDKITAELTSSIRSGMHKYTFPADTKNGSVIIDLEPRDKLLDVTIEKVNDREFRGYRRSKSWASDQTVYFYIVFDQPVAEEKYNEATAIPERNLKGVATKVFVSLHLPANKTLKVRIGISGVSIEGAKMNLDQEIPDWNFEKIKTNATKAWNKELSKIDVKGGTADQQTVFYTALYHTMLSPNVYQDVNGNYRGTDLKVHKANGFTNYSVFSLWDTYRAYHPLMTILNQKRTGDWINTFLAQYKNGGMLPVWELSGNETFCMIGYHSVPVIWDAYQKGIRNFDHKLALEAMRSYAESDRFGLEHYRKHGYISNDKEHESVSKTLEYAYDDWCIAQFAKAIGVDSVYKKYIERAQYYKNLFDPESKMFRGKLQSMWLQPFEPREVNNFYTEGNAWHYAFAVPQDIETLIDLHGSKDSFNKKLDELFNANSQTTGRDQADVTGLIGQYAQGNEPSHHMAYLYAYSDKKWKTEELVHKICNEFYKNSPDGLIGNEDCGQMSAWYIFSALGFYPVCPGSGEYVLGTPVFDKATIHLENGKLFTITAKRDKKSSFYVRNLQLNNKAYSGARLLHTDIVKGGLLNMTLTNEPYTVRNYRRWYNPTSKINDHLITPVPYFNIEKNKFKDSILVDLRSTQPGAEIWYYVTIPDGELVKPQRFLKPFFMYSSGYVFAFAMKDSVQSNVVQQVFHKLPDPRTITIFSKVHPLYTAGGPEALIDGITGSTNWRTGEWQSYFDTDFEAIVDLEKVTPISYLAVNVLQDVSPWIIYPTKVTFYTSTDGKEYKLAGTAINEIPSTEKSPSVQELGIPFPTSARYIKVIAVNGGKLPSWHESAGNPSHLFIDEIIVR